MHPYSSATKINKKKHVASHLQAWAYNPDLIFGNGPNFRSQNTQVNIDRTAKSIHHQPWNIHYKLLWATIPPIHLGPPPT